LVTVTVTVLRLFVPFQPAQTVAGFMA